MNKLATVIALSSAVLLFQSCQSRSEAKSPAAMPPPAVSVVEVQAQDVPVYSEYAAQTFARDLVEVRGRVDGYIEKRLFKVGSDVKAGQVLYVLDTRLYAADVEKAKSDVANSQANYEYAQKQVGLIQAQADLAQANANMIKSQQDVERLKPLVSQDAAPQQELDDAVASLNANKAVVAAKQANVDQNRLQTRTQIASANAQLQSSRALLQTSQLNLNYATIQAPVSGRIGDSLIEVGGLVSKTSTSPLTTIVPLDPIWVRFKVSEAEYLDYQKRKESDRTTSLPIHLILANNSVFAEKGRIENTVNQVDQKTGTLEIQATFPNPSHLLLPGQFGRVRMLTTEAKNVILVPQRAVQELQGQQSVLTVDSDNKVLARSVLTGDRVGVNWIILQGLKPGDRVIVEGTQKARPGAPVNPQPYKAHPEKTTTNPTEG